MNPSFRTLLCNCNRTMSMDAKTLTGAANAEGMPKVASELCRRHVAAFEAAAKAGDDLLVGCTQEAPLFSALHRGLQATGEMRFVNLRETAGWSEQSDETGPKMAALIAMATVPPPDAVPVVPYESSGEVLVIGPAAAALDWAERLSAQLSVTVLITHEHGAGELPVVRRYPVYSGANVALRGHLGAFEVSWEQSNPIDLEVCTRCGACAKACPEHAIDDTLQIDLTRCTGHRECVTACGSVKAIDFARATVARQDRFDLVLDLSREPLFRMSQPPQGYFAPRADPLEQSLAASQLAQLTGEFEKPRFYAYNERLCAHSRSGIVGCTKCVDVCSTAAITSDQPHDRIRIDPHLCMGCGGCASVCPSGAMTYAYPRAADLGTRLRAALGAYRQAGGISPMLLFHNTTDGAASIARLARRGRGLPAHVIPVEVVHIASIGADVLLGALALGASQVALLTAGSEAPEYRQALMQELELTSTIVAALGYRGLRLALVAAAESGALETTLWSLERCEAAPAATFNLSNEKRRTLEAAIEHLARHAPAAQEVIALSRGAPFGAVVVDRASCTLCMACVGACPSQALLDSKETPQLKFIERNCVQCGLCAKTCPEDAITLAARLLLTPAAKTAVVLNENEPFNCVRCAKPFGTRQMIDNMLGRLAGHSMFASAEALRRLQMCADCRVLDMMEKPQSATVFDFPAITESEE